MRHDIPPGAYGAHSAPMSAAVERCVHCGFCLPACPTYQLLGEEMDSPRGRIFLMKEVLEGQLTPAEAAPYVDRCLGCVACVTACPSGVEYGSLLTAYRGTVGARRPRAATARLLRALALGTIAYPARLRVALRFAGLARALRARLPATLRPLVTLMPETVPSAPPLAAVTPPRGRRRARVALLPGCAQQVLSPGISHAAVRVLAANGVEVVVPTGLGCCGALAAHTGELERARQLAGANLARLAGASEFDALVTTAAGCGSGIHEYPLWFAGHPMADEAGALAARSVDISRFLTTLGIVTPFALPAPTRVAYQDACHLAHAQRVRAEPRALLQLVDRLELVELADADTCCGSAGIYNLEQPDLAAALGERKARAVIATGASLVASGNIGCLVQLRAHLARPAPKVEVVHTIELLARALA